MNTDSDELLNEFASGRLVRPDWTKPNPVALARAISALGGYSPWGEDQLVTEIGQRLGQPDHTVVVIADGFGVNFVRGLPEDSFSRKHIA